MTQPAKTSYLDSPYALGLYRATIMFPLEHSIDMLKVSAQKFPFLSSWKVISDIYKERGFKGFAEGALPNYPRRVARDTLRWPAVGYSYSLLTSKFPETFTKDSTTSFVFSGFGAGVFDAFVLGPLEQLMAYRIKERMSYAMFFQKRLLQEGIASLYRGASVNLMYRCAVWGTFMGVDNEIKKKFASLNKDDLPPYAQEITSATVTSTVVVATLLPVDFIKTKIQMDPASHGKKVAFVAQSLVRKYGLRGFYAGAPIIWTFNVAYALVFQKVVKKAIEAFKED